MPRDSLAAIVRRRAEILARKRLARVSHSMLLEAQQLSGSEQEKAIEADVDALIRNMPKELWEGDHEL